MMHEISRNIMKYSRWNMVMLRDVHDKTLYHNKTCEQFHLNAQTPWHLLQCRCDPLPLWDTSANLRAMSHYKPEKVTIEAGRAGVFNKKNPQIANQSGRKVSSSHGGGPSQSGTKFTISLRGPASPVASVPSIFTNSQRTFGENRRRLAKVHQYHVLGIDSVCRLVNLKLANKCWEKPNFLAPMFLR